MTKPAGRLWTKCWSISWPRTEVFGDGDSRNGVHQSSSNSCRVKPAAESRFKTVSLEIRRWREITRLAPVLSLIRRGRLVIETVIHLSAYGSAIASTSVWGHSKHKKHHVILGNTNL